jgi:hypothetical protein
MAERIKDADVCIYLANGGVYYPLNPRMADVSIHAIAHMLATKARWNGATQHKHYPERMLYSVAEHSIYVSEYVEKELKRPELALAALLHDATEHVTGDILSVLKKSQTLAPVIEPIESENNAVIAAVFGVNTLMNKAIEIADMAVARAEYEQIVIKPVGGKMNDPRHAEPVKAARVDIQMLSPYEAKALFIRRFNKVMKAKRAA